MLRSSTHQAFIEAPVERVWQLVGDPNRHPDWRPEMLEVECADLAEGCREVSIFCDGTGVTTRFALTEAQGGTFVVGCLTIEPNTIGMKVLGAVAGRRFMHSWLETSLDNLQRAATSVPSS